MKHPAYETFIQRIRDIHVAHSIEYLLEWDQETQMPKRGAAARAEELAFIAGLAHERQISEELGGLLATLERDTDPADFVATTNIRETRRTYERAVRIPTELVRDIARSSALAKEAWVEARRESNFAKFAPHLEKLLDLKRRLADHVGWDTEPYDALMDEYEPGAKAADVQAVFDQVRSELVPLVAAIRNAPRQPDVSVLQRDFPRARQEALVRTLAAAIGYDFDAGRIDPSTHPFCSGISSPTDVRMTNRYDEHYLPMSLFGILHETGHALYEQGLEPQHAFTPMAAAVSLGIHESQSRWWENLIGRSRPFWQRYYPLVVQEFPSMSDVSLDTWHFAINAVRPSFIRVEADEVTYNLHIILRFDLERKLIAGKLAVRDVPAAWNAGMQSLLGITPSSDALGCLQDIHWSMGIFGYFPTYALGNLYAAQFFAAARKAMPEMDAAVARGELRGILDWLRTNVHRHGKRYRAGELVQLVSGAPLSHKPFVQYLNAKFRPLYGV